VCWVVVDKNELLFYLFNIIPFSSTEIISFT